MELVMIATKISSARAHIADPNAMAQLLGELPEAEEIRAELSKPYFTRCWQQSMQRSFWITSDGTTAVCLTLTGLNVDEMVAICVSFEEYRRRAGFMLSAITLSNIIEAELGFTVVLEH
jgi:hypothetical protein